MKYAKIFASVLFVSCFLWMALLMGCASDNGTSTKPDPEAEQHWAFVIQTAGNTWVDSSVSETETMIGSDGITGWTSSDSRIRTYFYLRNTGSIKLGIRAKVPTGSSRVAVRFGDEEKEVTFNNLYLEKVLLGEFQVTEPGYHWLELQGIEKAGDRFLDVSEILVAGVTDSSDITFVKDDFYWGRRGPSVHLSYEVPSEAGDVLWFYNEITVPAGEDVLGSYFMANGFAEGYFGMQVNGTDERRILFSVWSPYQTDNPGDIPEAYRITLLGKGEDVYTGEFGNEGSGGQSYRRFMWQAGKTYGFLLKAEPGENNSTDYTAWFYDPDVQAWGLIASFRRPFTSTYIKRPHSFLENFWTSTGHKSRQGYYGNQWVRDTGENWFELTTARFTADATARKGARLDYAGGAEQGRFYLKNCGFFSENAEIDISFTRTASGQPPVIDFDNLPTE